MIIFVKMNKIEIGGYKAINVLKEFKFAPITLLVGPNGSGKSSLINLLRLSQGVITEKRKIASSNKKLFHITNIECHPSSILELTKGGKMVEPIDINKDCESKLITIGLPIDLSYFNHEFTAYFKYGFDHYGQLLLKEFIIKSDIETFFHLKLLQSNFVRGQNLDPAETTYSGQVRINTEFIENEINKSINNKKFTNEYGFINNSEITEDDRNLIAAELYQDSISAKAYFEKLMNNLHSGFYESESCEIQLNQNDFNKQDMNPEILSDFKSFKDEMLLDFNKVDNEFSIINEEIQEQLIRDLNDLFVDRLNKGEHKVGFESNVGFLGLFFDFDNANNFINIENDQSRSLNLQLKGFSPKGELIIRELVFNNIKNALSKMNNFLGNYEFLSANRFHLDGSLESNRRITELMEEEYKLLRALNAIESHSLHFIKYWFKEFNLYDISKFNNISEVIKFLRKRYELSGSIGFGQEQLLPVICSLAFSPNYIDFFEISAATNNDFWMYDVKDVNSIFFNRKKLFILEEPEANLHPNFQSKLADLIIDASWKFGHQFVIESHSEYFVRKLQYWVAANKIKSDSILVYNFQKDSKSNLIIDKISINEDGTLSKPFGPGFYDEADRIALELYKANKLNLN